MNVNFKLIFLGAGYTLLIFILQKIIELRKEKNRIKYEINSKLYADKRIESISNLYHSIYELEIFVRDILIKQPENFKRPLLHDYYKLYQKTIDSINASHIFIDDNIYSNAMKFIEEANKAVIPASKKAELSDYFFQGNTKPLPDGIDDHWGLIQLTKEKTKELKVIYQNVIKLRENLRIDINKKIMIK